VLAHVRSSPRKLVVDPGRPNRRYSSGGPACVVPAHWASTGTRMRVVRLSAVMSGLFVLLSIPVLIFILTRRHFRLSVSARSHQHRFRGAWAKSDLTPRGRRSSEIKIVVCGPQTT